MSTIAMDDAAALSAQPDTTGLEILQELGAAERPWRSLGESAVASPYQRFDWIAAFARATGIEADIRVALVRDGAGAVAMLLPVVVTRRLGIRIASSIGGKHANFNLPLMSERFAGSATPDRLAHILREAGRHLRVDGIELTCVPTHWDGARFPLAGIGRPSPSNAYQVRLDPDPAATAHRSMTNEARKRLRNKERGLAKLGPVDLIEARTPAEVHRLLEAFFAQKEARFRALGIRDPNDEPGIRAFVERAALAGLEGGVPAIELYGLEVGGSIAAVLGGAADRQRLSGMFISFADREETTRFSPGDVLVSRIIAGQCLKGRRAFDLGVGEARYKQTFCDEPVTLVDILVPASAAGRLYAFGRGGAVALKRRVKQSPAAMRMLAALRKAKAGAAA